MTRAPGAGRKPQPTALKVVRGNPGRRPLSESEPQPKPIALTAKPPSWLHGARARRVWRDLLPILADQMRVLTEADQPALALLCDAYGEYVECADFIRKNGRTFEVYVLDREGQAVLTGVKPRPEVAMMQNARTFALRAMSEFGLSPSSRTKLHTPAAEEKDPFEEFLAGRQ